jgi:hypothetical protein
VVFDTSIKRASSTDNKVSMTEVDLRNTNKSYQVRGALHKLPSHAPTRTMRYHHSYFVDEESYYKRRMWVPAPREMPINHELLTLKLPSHLGCHDVYDSS